MAKKITNVSIEASNILRLEEDASKGDYIDLTDINKVDNKYINDLIEKEYKKRYLEDLDKEIKNIEERNKARIIELNSQNENKLNEQKFAYESQIKDLKRELETKEDEFRARNKEEILNHEKSVQEEIRGYKNQIDDLTRTIQFDKRESEQKLRDEIFKLEKEKDAEISKLSDELKKYKLEKANLGTKPLGEQLEKWCVSEYESFAMSGHDNCTREKYNKATKGDNEDKASKGDFIFKIYAEYGLEKTNLLSSVCLEMKNQADLSTVGKKNEDYYSQLDKNRNKAQCEYALLVSELEWNNDNDAPIVKVQGYEKMYRIRPQYMITFLSLLNALSLRYSKLILEKYDNDKKFKDSEELKKQFEDLKVTYFENPLSRIEKSAKEILTQSKNILNSAEKIHSLINKIIDDDLENARRKIETFEVEFNRYTRKLDKLEKE